jgi:hypothetical protein
MSLPSSLSKFTCILLRGAHCSTYKSVLSPLLRIMKNKTISEIGTYPEKLEYLVQLVRLSNVIHKRRILIHSPKRI